jgi:hypothetical protein
VKLLILVVNDEPDVELLFRQQFRRDLRDARFAMEFAHRPKGRFSASLSTTQILAHLDPVRHQHAWDERA